MYVYTIQSSQYLRKGQQIWLKVVFRPKTRFAIDAITVRPTFWFLLRFFPKNRDIFFAFTSHVFSNYGFNGIKHNNVNFYFTAQTTITSEKETDITVDACTVQFFIETHLTVTGLLPYGIKVLRFTQQRWTLQVLTPGRPVPIAEGWKAELTRSIPKWY